MQIIEETDILPVTSLCWMLYGPPGAWKTSLAQTAPNPLTLDFDTGIHRAGNRKAALRFSEWAEVVDTDAESRIGKADTIVVDTVGRMLDLMTRTVGSEDTKNRTRNGDLSITGWGVLKGRFAQWVGRVRTLGKDLVFIAHEKEERDGDNREMRPDIQGGSYTEVLKYTDMVGYLSVIGGKRILDFNPTDKHLGKNSAGFGTITIQDLTKEPTYFAKLMATAKERIGANATASAKLANEVAPWSDWIKGEPDLTDFNGKLGGLKNLSATAKQQVWNQCQTFANAKGWAFNGETKQFVLKG